MITYAPQLNGAAEQIFDMRSPFVLVDGTLSAKLSGAGAEIAIRTLAPKPRNAGETDQWSEWQSILAGDGTKQAELGRPRFNGRDVSIHGTYRFQIRTRVPQGSGLSALSMKLYFENGIMLIPPLFAGRNALRFRLNDASALTAPVTVVYRCETAAGEKTHKQVLRPADSPGRGRLRRGRTPGSFAAVRSRFLTRSGQCSLYLGPPVY